jgi:pyrimidine-nucleoside phosphorylase
VLLQTLIERKRDGGVLEPHELEALLEAYMSGDLADYQMSAFLMAVFFRGLTPTELRGLTRAIIASGVRLDLGDDGRLAVDKHSTGGVGDKVSLVLAPLLAEAGLRVPMISGRGLGHTGGTLDKLESIPGFDVNLDIDRFRSIVNEIGCAMIGQTPEIAPLDGRLYALRDVTGTVPAIPLIASSIVSKKVAEGISYLVLDVKFGDGAFMSDPEDARALARVMVGLAGAEGLRATALLTAMEAPLGRTVGNALEVREAIDCLAGGGPTDLRELSLDLSAVLLPPGVTRADLAVLLDNGTALTRFGRMIERQGGDPAVLDDPNVLPAAPVQRTLVANESGVVHAVQARAVGLAAVELGAGRRRVDDRVDPAVGFELHVAPGETVEAGQRMATIHARTEQDAEVAGVRLDAAIVVGPAETAPAPPPLVLERVERGV